MSISEQARIEAEAASTPSKVDPAPAGQPGVVGATLPRNGPINAFVKKYGFGGLYGYLEESRVPIIGIVVDYGVPIAVEALEALAASLRQGYADKVAIRESVPTSKDIVKN